LAVIGPFDSSPSLRDRCPRTSDSSRNGRRRWRRRALCRGVDSTIADSSQAIDVSFQTLLGGLVMVGHVPFHGATSTPIGGRRRVKLHVPIDPLRLRDRRRP
jgi:hypothetical protein